MDLLLEIGTEELPARLVGQVLVQLEEAAEKLLQEQRIDYNRLAVYSTPRRLVIYGWEMADVQTDLVEEVKGPPARAAFDDQGKPTKAASGFARSQGVAVEELMVKTTPAGDYVFAQKKISGHPTREVLAEQLPQLITGLSFPRPMRWGDRDLKFIRPIHWILCLLGDEVVEFEIDGYRSDRLTYGLRSLEGSGAISISHPREYFEKMQEASIIVDQNARKALIWKMAQETAAKAGGVVKLDEELLDEITNLVECPTPLCGSFDRSFLKLPDQVIITPMRDHQRYFPVWSRQDKLLNKFIAFANGRLNNPQLVTEGNEKVLRARLKDAQFFYEEDLKTPLESKVEKLREIVFMEGLGTLRDKVDRIVSLSRYLGSALRLTEKQRETAERAALLAKADLVTSMVYEFPELQGIMGEAYARAAREKKEVAQAIREHYLPRYAGDELPASKAGAVVALADKIDSLVGCFAMGLEPSGSQDPYALRRQALGVCHIILTMGLDLSLSDLIREAFNGYAGKELKADLPQVTGRLMEFFRARLRNFFLEQGYSYDLIEAALGRVPDRVISVRARLEALSSLKDSDQFGNLLTVFNRASNLARHAVEGVQVDRQLLLETAEQELYQAWSKIKKELVGLVQRGDYRAALLTGARLVEPVDTFFSGVLVMVDDQRIRANRLALLQDIADTLGLCGDLEKIVRAG